MENDQKVSKPSNKWWYGRVDATDSWDKWQRIADQAYDKDSNKLDGHFSHHFAVKFVCMGKPTEPPPAMAFNI